MSSDPRIAAFSAAADKTVQFLQGEYSKLQTGRANAALIEHVDVEAYGQRMQLKSVASVSVQDARTIVVQPWDAGTLQAVEKALQQANIGANPASDGVVLRLTLPQMTEERRKELTKVVHKLAEEARITIRQQRQAVHDAMKEEKDEDVKRTLSDQLQKQVDAANAKIDEARDAKEKEIMTI